MEIHSMRGIERERELKEEDREKQNGDTKG